MIVDISIDFYMKNAYIDLLYDDDEWEPEFLARMVPILNTNLDVVIAFSDRWIIDSQGSLATQATEECTHRYKRDSLASGFHRPFYRLALIDQSVPMVASLVRAGTIDWQDSPLETSSMYDHWVTYLAARTGKGESVVRASKRLMLERCSPKKQASAAVFEPSG
jgi:hypothetical protein